MKRIFAGAAVIAALATVFACSDHDHDDGDHADGGHSSVYPTCDAIIKRCHMYDVGEGPIHDCHEVGHDAKSDDPCVAKKDECFRICVPDAGAGDGGSDASADAAKE